MTLPTKCPVCRVEITERKGRTVIYGCGRAFEGERQYGYCQNAEDEWHELRAENEKLKQRVKEFEGLLDVHPQIEGLYELSHSLLHYTQKYADALKAADYRALLDIDIIRRRSHRDFYKAWSSLSDKERRYISAIIGIEYAPIEDTTMNHVADGVVRHCDLRNQIASLLSCNAALGKDGE